MKRLLVACLLPLLLLLVQPVAARADDGDPYRTVVDGIVPVTQGLSITGSPGGCDLLLDNQTGQDVLFFDMSKSPKTFKFTAPPKSNNSLPAVAVHFSPTLGVWPCASLPGITEDLRWNNRSATMLIWSMRGQVGALAFQLKAHTDYDPTLDPSAQWMQYLRLGGGITLVLGLLLGGPWLLGKRREILAPRAVNAGRP
ncbi:MAG TPA: hypothetical protein VET65_05200 [Candidatus Limnocylindrales bacterium]|nr:hypothetical protein [Candidatus Limnocylindrales bacterium]